MDGDGEATDGTGGKTGLEYSAFHALNSRTLGQGGEAKLIFVLNSSLGSRASGLIQYLWFETADDRVHSVSLEDVFEFNY